MTSSGSAWERFISDMLMATSLKRNRSLALDMFEDMFEATEALYPEIIDGACVSEIVPAAVPTSLPRPYDIADTRERVLIALLGSSLSLNT